MGEALHFSAFGMPATMTIEIFLDAIGIQGLQE